MISRRKPKRIMSLLLALIMLLTAGMYMTSAKEVLAAKKKNTPVLNKTSVNILMKKSVKLKLKKKSKGSKIKWKSSNKKIAKVTKKGKVTGKRKGIAKITATVTTKGKKYKLSCKVTVIQKANSIAITYNNGQTGKNVSLYQGNNLSLGIRKNPSTSNDMVTSWTSSNANIVKVDNNGKITAIKQGSASITATMFGKAKASILINVLSKDGIHVSNQPATIIPPPNDSIAPTSATPPVESVTPTSATPPIESVTPTSTPPLDVTINAKITIHEDFWEEFLEVITFGIYNHNDEQTVEITADSPVGIKSIEYCITNQAVDLNNIDILSFTPYDDNNRPLLAKGSISIVYAKVTNNTDNVVYIRSDGIIINNAVITSPDVPSETPSAEPSVVPSIIPSVIPSTVPSIEPSAAPTIAPSTAPTTVPSVVPSTVPSIEPSVTPSSVPSVAPSTEPSVVPSIIPSEDPDVLLLDLTNASNYIKVGEGASASWSIAENSVNVKTNNYSQGVAFKFTLPAGKTLADYESFEYDIKFSSDFLVWYKELRADASTTIPTTINDPALNATLGLRDGQYIEMGATSDKTVATGERAWFRDQVISIEEAKHADKSGTVYIAIGLHCGPTDGGNAFYVQNVRLRERPVAPPEDELFLDLTNTANYFKVGDSASVAWSSAENSVRTTTADYHQGIGFKFTLPTGKNLSDYEGFLYDLKFDSNYYAWYKEIRADASISVPSTIIDPPEDATLGERALGEYTESGATSESTLATETRRWYVNQIIP
ncbi:MAG: Ig-like domain-containing protein, partial [Lachnoclostridium sp.]|nr:Ig-like domain-containing protein [Lachnoclostridium sp.]